MKLYSRHRVIFLAGSGSETNKAEKLLKKWRVKYSKITEGSICGPVLYSKPALLVNGDVFEGIANIKHAIHSDSAYQW